MDGAIARVGGRENRGERGRGRRKREVSWRRKQNWLKEVTQKEVDR